MIECYGLRRERVKETSKRKLHVYSTMEEIDNCMWCTRQVSEGGKGGEDGEVKRVERWRMERV